MVGGGKNQFFLADKKTHFDPLADVPLCPTWGHNCCWLSGEDAPEKHVGLTQF